MGQKQHLSVNSIHRTLISNQGPTKMKGSLIILMTLIITITCDRARVDPGKARLEARDGSSVGRIDAGDARAVGRIDALDASAVGRIDARDGSSVGRIDAEDARAVYRRDARDGSSVGRIDAGDARASGIEGSNSLLMGKLIGQGAIRSEVVGLARQQGVGPSEIEEVKGREVAESARQHVDPQDELQIGRKIKEYQQNPQDAQVRMDIGSARGGHGGPSAPMMTGPISRARGKVLDEDVQSGRAVPNPIKVLGEIKARGGDIETVQGEIVAGDAGDIDVISMKESRLDEEGRSPCGSSCPTGTICCLASRTCDSTCPDDRRSDEEGRTRCGKRCPTGTICCIASRTCDSTCSDDRRSDEEERSPVGRETCSDGQIYCTHTSTCTLPEECRIG